MKNNLKAVVCFDKKVDEKGNKSWTAIETYKEHGLYSFVKKKKKGTRKEIRKKYGENIQVSFIK